MKNVQWMNESYTWKTIAYGGKLDGRWKVEGKVYRVEEGEGSAWIVHEGSVR